MAGGMALTMSNAHAMMCATGRIRKDRKEVDAMAAAAYYPANERYNRKNKVNITVSLNRATEPELVAWMEGQPNRGGYIKRLIREDMERERDSGNDGG